MSVRIRAVTHNVLKATEIHPVAIPVLDNRSIVRGVTFPWSIGDHDDVLGRWRVGIERNGCGCFAAFETPDLK